MTLTYPYLMVLMEGVEPSILAACGLKPHVYANSTTSAYEECLPITPRLHILLVEVTGFEPVVSWYQTKHSAPTELNLEIYFSFIFYIYYIKNFKKNQITEK